MSRVAYLGPPGTFSHIGALAHFGEACDLAAVERIAEVFRAVELGWADHGILPIENAHGGSIAETLQGFCDTTLMVCGEVLVGIHHQLLARCEPDQIRRIHSKPEVFAQCASWLEAHYPQAELIGAPSTSHAARHLDEVADAAIASTLASQLYGVPIRHADIEDDPHNVTRFVVLGSAPALRSGQDKTAVLFSTPHEPGALVRVLQIFAGAGINLTHIDKRPAPGQHWRYQFIIEGQGHPEDAPMAQALGEAARHCTQLRVLGSFAEAPEVY